MNRDLEIDLVKRALGQASTSPTAADAGPSRRPVADYFDPQRFTEEQQALFRSYPVVVGHTAQLSEPDSWFTHDHSGVPILVTRAADGELRAFLNVCRHRGAKAAAQPCGQSRRLTCRFHGWTYDLEGRLRGLPQPEAFGEADRSGIGLASLPIAERHGLIFVRPQADGGPIDLDTVLGGVSTELEDHRSERHVLATRSWEVDCNWKVLLDNFLEMYHVPLLHGSNIGPLFRTELCHFEPIGHNGRRIDPRTSFASLAALPSDSWRLRDHALLTYFIFPNLQTFWTRDYFSWLSVWPIAPDRSVCSQLIAADWTVAEEGRQAHLQANLDLFDLTLSEDFGVSEEVQRGLACGANDTVVFGRHEAEAAAVHTNIDQALARWRRGVPADAWPAPQG